jgi:N-acetylmuramoyl-L-alanine amidase
VSDFFERPPGEPGTRMVRREETRRRIRRRRLLALLFVLVLAAAAAGLAVWHPWRSEGASSGAAGAASGASAAGTSSGSGNGAPAAANGAGAPATGPSAGSASSVSPGPSPTDSQLAPAPPIVQDPVPYGPARKAEMAAYSKRHYGDDTWVLKPSAIVLHYTGTYTYAAAHNTFASDASSMGETPGVATHFVIDKDGTIYQQVPLNVRARHTIGLNWCAVGIEFVQEAGPGPTWAIDQIFARRRQIDAGLRLVSWLQATYSIPLSNVIGHATANASPLFKDLEGWRNDHVDFGAPAVVRFKVALAQGV